MKTKLVTFIALFVTAISAFAKGETPTPTPTVAQTELQSAMSDFVKQVTITLTQGKNFAIEQAPDVCREYLRWSLVEDIGWLIASLIGGTILICVGMWLFGTTDDMCWKFWGISCGMLIICCFGIPNVMDAIKIEVAPKVYIMEYVKSLVK